MPYQQSGGGLIGGAALHYHRLYLSSPGSQLDPCGQTFVPAQCLTESIA